MNVPAVRCRISDGSSRKGRWRVRRTRRDSAARDVITPRQCTYWGRGDTGLFCRCTGLLCGGVGLVCGGIGLFCSGVGLFGGIGLFCTSNRCLTTPRPRVPQGFLQWNRALLQWCSALLNENSHFWCCASALHIIHVYVSVPLFLQHHLFCLLNINVFDVQHTQYHATHYIWWLASHRQHTSTRCNKEQHVSCTRKHLVGHTLQHIANIATHANTLQHNPANYNRWVWVWQGSTLWAPHSNTQQPKTTPRNTLQHTATHCNNWNTLQHIVTHYTTHYSTLYQVGLEGNTPWAPHSDILRHTAIIYITLPHTATHCGTLQHAAKHYNRWAA